MLIKEKILKTTFNWEQMTLYSIYSLAILIPFIIGKPQLLVGSFINFLIVYSTLKYGIKKTVPVLILPSLSAVGTGLLFGGATYFLLILSPFIMISNYILSYFIFKKGLLNSILGVILKGVFLVVVYRVLIELVGLPSIFISSSYMQFITASIGVGIALTLYKFTKN